MQIMRPPQRRRNRRDDRDAHLAVLVTDDDEAIPIVGVSEAELEAKLADLRAWL